MLENKSRITEAIKEINQMKKTVLILLLLITGVVGILLFINTTKGQQSSQQDSDDVPTVVTRGKFTEKEKKYSKEYKKLYPDRTEKLGEAVRYAKERKSQGEVTVSIGIPMFPTVGLQPSAREVLRNLSCEADAVVLGSVENKESHLTEDETWIYTEYDFLVDEIIKDNLALSIVLNDKIKITRPGGLIKLDNQVVRVQDRLYEQLKKNKKYLLFLKFVPSTQGYLVSNVKGDFVLEGKRLKSLSQANIPNDLKSTDDYQFVLSNVRNFTLEDCSQKLNGEELKQ